MHIIPPFKIILFPFGERDLCFIFSLVCTHFELAVGCLSSEWNVPLLISAAVMWLCPRCEQGWAVPRCSTQRRSSRPQQRQPHSIQTVYCEIDRVRTPGALWTCLSLFLAVCSAFISLSSRAPSSLLSCSPFLSLVLRFAGGGPHAAHFWGYCESFVMYFLLYSSYILCLHASTSRQVWTRSSLVKHFMEIDIIPIRFGKDIYSTFATVGKKMKKYLSVCFG